MRRAKIGLALIGVALVAMFAFAVSVQEGRAEGASVWYAIGSRWLLLPVPVALWIAGGWLYLGGLRSPVDDG